MNTELAPSPQSLDQRNDALCVLKPSTRVRVLIVEDDPVQALLLSLLLEHQGVETCLATDGAQAVELVRAGDYAMVLMDYRMPTINGIEATQQIRKWESEQHRLPIPIIATTASGMVAECHAYRAAGMDDVVLKPYSAVELARVLAQHAHTPGSSRLDRGSPQ